MPGRWKIPLRKVVPGGEFEVQMLICGPPLRELVSGPENPPKGGGKIRLRKVVPGGAFEVQNVDLCPPHGEQAGDQVEASEWRSLKCSQ